MDRFIEKTIEKSEETEENLKSNMDRFIGRRRKSVVEIDKI